MSSSAIRNEVATPLTTTELVGELAQVLCVGDVRAKILYSTNPGCYEYGIMLR